MPPEHSPKTNLVLEGLELSDLSLIRPYLESVFIPAGGLLQAQGLPFEHVYFPHQGLISLVAGMSEPEEVEIASVGRDGAFCSLAPSGLERAFATAIARTPLRVSRIPAATLRSLAEESATVDAAIERCMETLQLQIRQTAICNALHSVEQRVVRWLLQTSDRAEDTTLPVTQALVAQLLGVRRTTITLVSGNLQQAGAILWRRSRVDILDRAKLEGLTCGCYTALQQHIDRVQPAPLVATAAQSSHT